MEIIAHRGSSYTAAENTLASVKLAWAQGSDAVEIDIHLSADKRIMVIHDATTLRTSGIDLAIADTNSKDLRKLDVGSLKSSEYAGQKIPFLEEVLQTIPEGKNLVIELKSNESIIPFLQETIIQSNRYSQITIISFNLSVLLKSKEAMLQIPAYLLLDTAKDETGQIIPYSEKEIQIAIDSKLNGLSVNQAGINEDFVRTAVSAGIEIYVWVINDPVRAEQLTNLGLKGITTDKPDIILSV